MTKEDIRKQCANQSVYIRAESIYRSGMLYEIEIDSEWQEGEVWISAVAEGSGKEDYEVSVCYDEYEDDIVTYECDCLAFAQYPGMCKHCAALALYWQERQTGFSSGRKKLQREVRTDRELQLLIQNCALKNRMELQRAEGDIELEPELTDNGVDYRGIRHWYLTFKIGNTRKYVLKNLEEFVDHVRGEKVYSYGKQLSFMHSKSMFTEKAWKYVQLIAAVTAMYADSYQALRKELPLNGAAIEKFLMMNLGQEVSYQACGRRFKTLHVLDRNPPIRFQLEAMGNGEGYTLQIPQFDCLDGPEETFVLLENKIYRCSQEFRKAFTFFSGLGNGEAEQTYQIAKKDMTAFCGAVLPELRSAGLLETDEISLKEFEPLPAEIAFYLDAEQGRVTVKVTGRYGTTEHNLLSSKAEDGVFYDVLKERRALDTAAAYFSCKDGKAELFYFPSEDEEQFYRLLSTGLSQMEEEGIVYATDQFKGTKIVRSPRAQIGVALKSGLLELTFNTEGFTREELADILKSYRKKKKYYRMRSGDFLSLEESSLGTVSELLEGLNLKDSEFLEDRITVPAYRACYIDRVLQENKEQLQVERNADYKAVIRGMKNVADSDYEVPENLANILRSYQKTGYRWLRTLADLGFGGILADDMGLGKTIQTIAYLLARKSENADKPSLIVCPASLVYNWERELWRFGPELSVKMIAGSVESRQKLLRETKSADVWITSYDLLKRDISSYEELEFDTQVLDEAQNIKNQGTQAAKSVKKIRAQVRFALTGTPIENRLSELWSIFDYLMPGILGSYDRFRKTYEIPIVHEQDQEAAERLKKIITPFILRRMKQDVLKELPDKVEQVVYAEMEAEQKAIYMAHADRMLQMLQKQSEQEVQNEKIQILAELTRLRQICCDPHLLFENYKKLACKVEVCEELVKDAVEGNHKVLIFSQFPSIFPILQARLKPFGIECYVLTGATPKERRLEMAESFSRDQIPVFLISLKAGGTGLNLTGASIVIHFDPWWNLAAQNQATDRAHRIGQKNQVTIYKLIAKDSIEEKIIGLQEKKKQLAGQFLEGEGISAASLTREDLMEILNV